MAQDEGRAYLAGLRMLARRELAEAQVRTRLTRRGFAPADIDAATARLRRERALDDRRTALAVARTEASVKRRGQARARRRIEAIGIAPELAREAVREVYADLDEHLMVERAVERKLRGGASLEEPATASRVYRYLLGQGFDSHCITTVMGRASRRRAPSTDE